MKDSTKNDNTRHPWFSYSGPLPVSLTNDYLFKAINQENATALKSLLCAVLHCDPEQIISTEITNSIELGKALSEKDFRLDVKISMNNNVNIDLEMQVDNRQDWPERSLQYLCRMYDSLNKGQDYIESKTAIQIGIVDFEVFKKESALLDSYRLMNVKTQKVYSDKFQLYTLCLPLADFPDEEDIYYHTNIWAAFFRAKTWEELNMLIKEDEGIEAAVETAEKLWADDRVREQILAREDYYRMVRTEQLRKQQMVEEIAQLQSETSQLQSEKSQLQSEKSQLQSEKSQLQSEKSQLQSENMRLQDQNARQQQRIAELEAKLKELHDN